MAFPREQIASSEHDLVAALVRVDATGRVMSAHVMATSNSRLMDQMAIQTLLQSRVSSNCFDGLAGDYLMGVTVDQKTGNPTGNIPNVLQFQNKYVPAQATTPIQYF